MGMQPQLWGGRTHHAAIVKVTGERYRLREAARDQKARRAS
jgi:hypothetical protein